MAEVLSSNGMNHGVPPPPSGSVRPDSFAAQQDIKATVHRELIKRIDLEKLGQMQQSKGASEELFKVIQQLISEHETPLSSFERFQLAGQVLDEVFGLGPLEPLLQDHTINDILVNGCNQVYVERRGRLEKSTVVFKDDRHLMHIIDKIVSSVGRRIDESSPMVDARLADGSRVNVIIPPLAIDGPSMSIRKFGSKPLQAADLLANKALTQPMLDVLCGAVKSRMNIIISGGTGAGKTTLLNMLSSFIPEDERVVTIEDSAELQLKQEHVVRLETRPPNVEGKGAIRQRELVINALRMRPDRIILGEIRGGEALDMLQAMNTGHDGSVTTVHANTPRDAMSRIQMMSMMGDLGVSEKAIRSQIASAIDLVIQVARMSDGTRRITHITELTGTQGEVISMQDIFVFEKQGLGAEGKVKGRFRATGIVPKCAERFKESGIPLPPGLLDHEMAV